MHVAQAPEGMNRQLCKDLLAITIMARLSLLSKGHSTSDLVIFEQRRRKSVGATDAGLAARCRVAGKLDAEALRSLRRQPSQELAWSQMRMLAEAGILACPGSGLPVFDPTNAPPSLWAFFTSLADALNTPSEEASTRAAVAAEEVAEQLRSSASASRSVVVGEGERERVTGCQTVGDALAQLASRGIHGDYLTDGRMGEQLCDDKLLSSVDGELWLRVRGRGGGGSGSGRVSEWKQVGGTVTEDFWFHKRYPGRAVAVPRSSPKTACKMRLSRALIKMDKDALVVSSAAQTQALQPAAQPLPLLPACAVRQPRPRHRASANSSGLRRYSLEEQAELLSLTRQADAIEDEILEMETIRDVLLAEAEQEESHPTERDALRAEAEEQELSLPPLRRRLQHVNQQRTLASLRGAMRHSKATLPTPSPSQPSPPPSPPASPPHSPSPPPASRSRGDETSVPAHLTDPITLQLFEDPVQTPCCGNMLSRSSLRRALPRCPLCRADIRSQHSAFSVDEAPRNRAIADLVEQQRAMGTLPPPGYAPPSLHGFRTAQSRGPGTPPAKWYFERTGTTWDGQAASYRGEAEKYRKALPQARLRDRERKSGRGVAGSATTEHATFTAAATTSSAPQPTVDETDAISAMVSAAISAAVSATVSDAISAAISAVVSSAAAQSHAAQLQTAEPLPAAPSPPAMPPSQAPLSESAARQAVLAHCVVFRGTFCRQLPPGQWASWSWCERLAALEAAAPVAAAPAASEIATSPEAEKSSKALTFRESVAAESAASASSAATRRKREEATEAKLEQEQRRKDRQQRREEQQQRRHDRWKRRNQQQEDDLNGGCDCYYEEEVSDDSPYDVSDDTISEAGSDVGSAGKAADGVPPPEEGEAAAGASVPTASLVVVRAQVADKRMRFGVADKWIAENTSTIRKLDVPAPDSKPRRRAVRLLCAVVATPDGDKEYTQAVHYSLPPLCGESCVAAKQRRDRHRWHEKQAIRKLDRAHAEHQWALRKEQIARLAKEEAAQQRLQRRAAVVCDGRTLYDPCTFERIDEKARARNRNLVQVAPRAACVYYPDGSSCNVALAKIKNVNRVTFGEWQAWQLVEPWTRQMGKVAPMPCATISFTPTELEEIIIAAISMSTKVRSLRCEVWRDRYLRMEACTVDGCMHHNDCVIYQPPGPARSCAELASIGLDWAVAAWAPIHIPVDCRSSWAREFHCCAGPECAPLLTRWAHRKQHRDRVYTNRAPDRPDWDYEHSTVPRHVADAVAHANAPPEVRLGWLNGKARTRTYFTSTAVREGLPWSLQYMRAEDVVLWQGKPHFVSHIGQADGVQFGRDCCPLLGRGNGARTDRVAMPNGFVWAQMPWLILKHHQSGGPLRPSVLTVPHREYVFFRAPDTGEISLGIDFEEVAKDIDVASDEHVAWARAAEAATKAGTVVPPAPPHPQPWRRTPRAHNSALTCFGMHAKRAGLPKVVYTLKEWDVVVWKGRVYFAHPGVDPALQSASFHHAADNQCLTLELPEGGPAVELRFSWEDTVLYNNMREDKVERRRCALEQRSEFDHLQLADAAVAEAARKVRDACHAAAQEALEVIYAARREEQRLRDAEYDAKRAAWEAKQAAWEAENPAAAEEQRLLSAKIDKMIARRKARAAPALEMEASSSSSSSSEGEKMEEEASVAEAVRMEAEAMAELEGREVKRNPKREAEREARREVRREARCEVRRDGAVKQPAISKPRSKRSGKRSGAEPALRKLVERLVGEEVVRELEDHADDMSEDD